nr:ribonuclease H-like domain-containing protein [Tanacetum cinerariifolium]
MPQSVPQIVPEHAPAPTNDSPTMSIHPIVTRSRIGTTRPNPRYAGHVSTISPLPWSYKEAFNDPNCRNAMFDEYNALIKNKTWTSVPRPEGANIVRCMWLFRHKFLADGTVSRYKARLVSNGSTQVEGVDVDETFSLVVKPGTIRNVLSLAISRHWHVHQLDVKNAFLQGDLAETIYMQQPPGFWDPEHPSYGDDTVFLLLYVDDIVLTASPDRLLQQIIASLHREFSMIDLGALNYFLGILVTRDSSVMFLSQRTYAMKILERSFQYLTFTRPDITYVVQQHQPMLSRSSAEAEYRDVANVVAETCWIQNLLRELHTPLSSATIVYCDNVSAVYLSSNLVQHQRTKHIEINIHYVWDLVATGRFHRWFWPWWHARLHYMVYGVCSNFEKRVLDDCFLCFLFNWNKHISLTCLGNCGKVWVEVVTWSVFTSVSCRTIVLYTSTRISHISVRKREGAQNEREVVASKEDEIKDVTLDIDKTVAGEIQNDEAHHTLKKDDPVDRAGPSMDESTSQLVQLFSRAWWRTTALLY